MMSSDSNPTTLELTEVESKLRQLLLDVAAFIDETSVSGATKTTAKVPEDLVKEKVVLRFTGGWVRDKLLGVGSQDIDVAINKMTGEQFGLRMVEYLEIPGKAAKYGLEPKEANATSNGNEKSRKIAPGLHKIVANPEKSKNLETATTKIMGIDIDLVNLRKESYNEMSRNPQMEFGTPEEDAMRRDATVNAMFFNLNTSQIEDFTGRGFDDMAAKIIRTPLEPSQTFKDDPLRVLRLIRFASRLNYTIDPETEKAMSNKEIGEVLKVKISRERVGIELEKMLKGPDPLMALSLIDRLGIYNTIFTDPTRELTSKPEPAYFSSAYIFVNSLLQGNDSDIPEIFTKTFVRDLEEKYLAWLCAALMPWVDTPTIAHEKATQRPYYVAYLVAKEGFKAPNKICDVIAASLKNGEEIRSSVGQCYGQSRGTVASNFMGDATGRDTLGMAIRRWGVTWRTQVLFSLIYELVLGTISRERVLQSYSVFLNQITNYDLLEAYAFKPLLTGTELARALNCKPGPWMKDALDVVMAWQLRNPTVTDQADAIEAVRTEQDQGDNRTSELTSCLASHFLRLTIRPLFSQSRANPSLTPAGHKASHQDPRSSLPDDTSKVPWKDTKNSVAVDLLRWSLYALDEKGVEGNWGFLIPPILKMIDDIDLKWKSTGCAFLTLLLKSTSIPLLERTGLGHVFEDTLMPLFTYLPTLTPEDESVLLLDKVHPALVALAEVMHPASSISGDSSPRTTREKFLDKILRDGVLAPLFHAPPSMYPRLATSLLSQLPVLITSMGIDSVKHLQALTVLLSNVLAEPLGLAYPQLLITAAKGHQTVILNGWPRIAVHKGEIMRGVTLAWLKCCEDSKSDEDIEKLKAELADVIDMLDSVLTGDERGWEKDKNDLILADERLSALLCR